MSTLKQLMGLEVYDLLYIHYDKGGVLIDDMEDVIYCEDDDIPQERIVKLEALLMPINDIKSLMVPIEAAKLLAAWGNEKAIDYFEYCIDSRIDLLGNGEPHRLHTSYDETYERIIEACLHYHARRSDKDYMQSGVHDGKLSRKAREKIYPVISKIILLSKEVTLDMGYFIRIIQDEGWKEFLPILKECYLDFLQRPENDLNRKWNLVKLIELIEEWDPDFVKKPVIK